jgi:cellulose synthase/poly-beta-1,6-N-acetylglucosamine synthase-like glycosyltransferase
MILFTIEILALFVLGFFLFYLAMLSLFASIARKKIFSGVNVRRRFAIVVPAHDEESSIGKTLRSLLEVDYPKEAFDIVVIADNCTDATAEISRRHNVTVLERTNANLRGKGYALRWCFDQLLSQHAVYDAILVIDADTIIANNVLSVMNYYLERGSKAIQCSDMVEPQPGAWSSEIIRFGFTLYNHARPLGRSVLNCSAGVRGNGMCFSCDTLRAIPWNTYSLNEDLEYGLILLLNGINTDFAPEAKVFATMPVNARNAESQRSRWEKGRFPVIKHYGPKLLVSAVKQFSFRAFDAFVELVTPPFVNLFGAVLFMLCLNILLWQFGVSVAATFSLLWLIVVTFGFVHVLVGLYASDADALLYKAFFYIPRYAAWKFWLSVKTKGSRSTEEWVRTTRDQAVPSQTTGEQPVK